MYAMGRARVRREFATGGSGLLGWGLFGRVFFFFFSGDYIKILYNQQKRGNRKRQSRSKAAKGLV